MSSLSGAPAPPGEGGVTPDPGATTPALAVETYERAIATDGFDAVRRWPPPRKMGETLHTTAWNTATGHQVVLVWYTGPDAPFQWTFDRLVEIFDHRRSPYINYTDVIDVAAKINTFFGAS